MVIHRQVFACITALCEIYDLADYQYTVVMNTEKP
jgi:hypothetical protein